MADEAEVGSSAKMKDNGSVSSKTSVESGDEYEVEKIIGVCKSKVFDFAVVMAFTVTKLCV